MDIGDTVELVGAKHEVDEAAKKVGHADCPTNQTDMAFIGLGILIRGLIGALSVHMSDVPIGLNTSGGVLIGGLPFSRLWSKHPASRHIPEPALWILDSVGLNTFITVVGIATSLSFVQGFKEVGLGLFIIGTPATSIPLIVGILMGKYLFKFHPVLISGCTAGTRTTTAALDATQEAIESETPVLGYTVTYAMGSTLLIIWGVVIALFI